MAAVANRARRPWDDLERPRRVGQYEGGEYRSPALDFRSKRRRELEELIEQAIAALDAFDGDPDLEDQCEDEGAQCEGEGEDSDREPDLASGGTSYPSMTMWPPRGTVLVETR